MQEKLDLDIFQKFSKTYGETFAQRKLALLVELAELANEVRSFKYWSLKEASDKAIILDEYADGLHFIAGFCVMYKIEGLIEVKDFVKIADKNKISKKFNKLFAIASSLDEDDNKKKSVKKIDKYFSKYLELGYALGFKFADIQNAYLAKHEVNINRQKNNY